MIRRINIKNLKSLVDIDLELSNLTLLTGLNNSGKSTLIQAIRMYIKSYYNNSPLLEGHGRFYDLLSKTVSKKQKIEIKIDYSCGEDELIIAEDGIVNAKKVPELLYVGADRLGPQLHLPLNTAFDSKLSIGDKGEYVVDFIKRLIDDGFIVNEALEHPASKGTAFEYALKGWMSEIAPNVEFEFSINSKADIGSTEIDNYRPIHVGFGLSYTLPIVAAALGALAELPGSENSSLDLRGILSSNQNSSLRSWLESKKENGILLIVENPEAHLHPQGQTAMGKLLSLVANNGVQVIVETHSEHVMDGIRIAVKEKIIDCKKVQFNYFVKNLDGHSEIQRPQIDSNGKLSFWPKGFFDQTLKNRAILAKKS